MQQRAGVPTACSCQEQPFLDEAARARNGVSEALLPSSLGTQGWRDMCDNVDTYFRPRVHDINEVTSGIGFPDGLEHLFVLQTPSTEARKGLAAPADGGLWEEAAVTWSSEELAVGPSPEQRAFGQPAPHTSVGKGGSDFVEIEVCLFLIQVEEPST